MAQAREVLKEIDRRFEAGTPFSHSPHGGARYLGHYLAAARKLTRKAAEKLIADWLTNEVVAIETCNQDQNSGLKVRQWL